MFRGLGFLGVSVSEFKGFGVSGLNEGLAGFL